MRLFESYKYRYLIFALIFSGYLLVYFHRLCPAVLALDIQEAFSIGGALMGVMASAYFYPYALMQLPTGLLVDRWGPRRIVSSFLVIAGVGAFLMAYTDSLALAVFGRVLVGLGVATLFVSNFKLISAWFSPKQFVIVGGFFMTMGGMGALLASAPLAWISGWIGWRQTFAVVGGMTFVMALLIFVFVRNSPVDIGLPPLQSREKTRSNSHLTLWQGLKSVVTAGRFWPVSIWTFCSHGIAFSFGGLWGGPFLMQFYGLSKSAAGGILSTFALALIFGAPLLGWGANRFGRKVVMVGCSTLLLIVCLSMYFFMNWLNSTWLYILFFCFFVAGGAVGPIQATVSKELFPAELEGTAMGSVNIFPFFGGAVFPIWVGLFMEEDGALHTAVSNAYQKMFLFYVVVALIALAAAGLTPETLGQDADSEDFKLRKK